jgi:hypothetical protein
MLSADLVEISAVMTTKRDLLTLGSWGNRCCCGLDSGGADHTRQSMPILVTIRSDMTTNLMELAEAWHAPDCEVDAGGACILHLDEKEAWVRSEGMAQDLELNGLFEAASLLRRMRDKELRAKARRTAHCEVIAPTDEALERNSLGDDCVAGDHSNCQYDLDDERLCGCRCHEEAWARVQMSREAWARQVTQR